MQKNLAALRGEVRLDSRDERKCFEKMEDMIKIGNRFEESMVEGQSEDGEEIVRLGNEDSEI